MEALRIDAFANYTFLSGLRCGPQGELAFVAAQAEMEENELLIDSIMFRIVQMAENGAKLSEAFRAEYPDIPWVAICGMRNRIVHNYGVVSMAIVYDTVSNHMPKMYAMLKEILDEG